MLLKLTILILIAATNAENKFPVNFKFGVATSAYQVEGGWNADGKGVSYWDHMTHTYNFAADGSNGDIACNTYEKYKSDIQLLKDLKVHFYRFSLSWTRIYPNGYTNYVNPAGVDYYRNLMQALLDNGIEPIVTIYHWDVPQNFAPLGLLQSDTFIQAYVDYADGVFNLFGDLVKTWITFNEPKVVCVDFQGYIGTISKPYPLGHLEYLCGHNIIKAHALTYHLYQRKYKSVQNGRIGITLNFEWYEPATVEDEPAAEQRRQFEFGIYANPILNFDYPKIVRDRVNERSRKENFPRSRLPKFTTAEKLTISGTFDFLGLNHYSSWMVKWGPDAEIGEASVEADTGMVRYQEVHWESTALETTKVVPFGLRNALKWIKKTYNDPEILITECGYPDHSGTISDAPRTNYLQGYINATLQALFEDEVRVTAFTAWSFLDNFEWGHGYTVKFGLYHVDFDDDDRKRTPKDSVEYYRSVIESRQP